MLGIEKGVETRNDRMRQRGKNLAHLMERSNTSTVQTNAMSIYDTINLDVFYGLQSTNRDSWIEPATWSDRHHIIGSFACNRYLPLGDDSVCDAH
jgi:hypothetical protein